jgi:light-regulated signal transduction histidine kinase (bacteriophytochrome)
LSACAREPIHIPGSIQPHGTLLVLGESDLAVEQAAANTAAVLGRAPADLLGRLVEAALDAALAGVLRARVPRGGDPVPVQIGTLPPAGGRPALNVIAHRHDGRMILEFDPAPPGAAGSFQALYQLVRDSIQRLEDVRSLEDLYTAAAEEVRRLAGFDRVMIYQFDDDWHGRVVGEARDPAVTSYLDHHFPASDIPAQARELYRLNRSRVIADAAYTPVPLLAAGPSRPADLSYALLRSVSPVHIEYLHNMGVAGSTSFSVIRNGRLWGLVACHHRAPLHVPFDVRTACEFLAQVVSLQIGAQQQRAHDEHRLRLQAAQTRLLAAMSAEDNLLDSLLAAGPQLLDFMSAGGAALYFDRRVTLIGATPTEAQVQTILDGVVLGRAADLYSTDSLPADLPAAGAFTDTAAGLLAMRVSEYVNSYILWFRSETVRTITWGGDPTKPAEHAGGPGAGSAGGAPPRIHPRKSFEQWRQIVKDRSRPWTPEEIGAAGDFRSAVVNIVLRKVEELASVSAELKRANSELEAFSYSVSHDLRAPFRHIAGFSDLLERRTGASLDETARRYVRTIGDAARHAGKLVDALLAFSHIARVELRKSPAPLAPIVANVRRDLEPEARGRNVTWTLALAADAAVAYADPTLLHLVLQNLVSNALKFTRGRDPAEIEIRAAVGPPDPRFAAPPADGHPRPQLIVHVRDNGVGFDNKYVHKLFGPFQRLHRNEEFEGTGIGLANVKRIVERHGGAVWAEGVLGRGATVYFSLPLQEPAA